MNFPNSTFVGLTTLAAGVSSILQITFLTLMFTVAMNPYGPISDYFYAFTPVLIVPLLLALRTICLTYNATIPQLLLLSGILGVIVAAGGQVLLLVKAIDLRQSFWANSVGMGLLGLTVLGCSLLARANPAVPGAFGWLGVILGVALAVSLLSGLFFLDDVYALASGGLNLSGASPFMYLVLVFGVINQFGLPAWLLWAAWLFLSGRLTLPA